VTISAPFAVGRLHVTGKQFAEFVREANKYRVGFECRFGVRGFLPESSHPVVCASWDDAKAYVDWLAMKTGKPYRLLSEAEWEYAARGQTSPGAYPRFWLGNDEKGSVFAIRYTVLTGLTGPNSRVPYSLRIAR
jgi:formylglycine-generating enzyme required for sulfatase activity